ncbi:hypothetical protein O181_040539 [Austropuccinia psidii MF-1]|uniref:Uncharacterized protein n=1 Tax=Austropuccinia psidii MF-1 TaxID=1389203 RepID=A0A9Q3DCG3_9BASI|nr:hypothetical protein [Austropuccinia psidii MF-1]
MPLSMGHLGPLWPNSNEAKRGQGGSSSAPKARWVPKHKWAPNCIQPRMAIKDPQDPKCQKLYEHHFSVHGLWKPLEATISAPRRVSPHIQGKASPSSMHPVLEEPGVVHIWYNIPLCTIFCQQSNGDIFRTQLSDSKSSPKSITNFKGGPFSHSVWQFPGSYQKTIQVPQPSGPAGVGLSILIRTILRAILRGNKSFKSF